MTRLYLQDNALLQYSQIDRLERPNNMDVKNLQEWLNRPEGGDFFLRGREAEIWQNEEDLITFANRKGESDSLTRLINEQLAPWYYYRWGYWVKVYLKYRTLLRHWNLHMTAKIYFQKKLEWSVVLWI